MRRLVFAASAAVLMTTIASAQDIVSAKAGLIHLMEGKVLINGVEAEQKGDQFLSLKEGEILSTERGRAEVLLNAGSYLRLGENSSFKLTSSYLEDTRFTVLSGTALVEIAELPKDTGVTLDFLGSQVELKKRGLYEFTADAPGRARVYDGEIALQSEGAFPIKIAKNKEIAFDKLAAGPVKFDQTVTTALYRWGARRARYIAAANEAAARNGNTYGSGYSSGFASGYRGIWAFNPMFGMYTYLPLSGYGYSPYSGVVLYSPATVYLRYAAPVMIGNSGFDAGSSARSAVSSPNYSAAPSGGGAALPAATAPAVATPNVGGGDSGGAAHRR